MAPRPSNTHVGSASTVHKLTAQFEWPAARTDSSIAVTLSGKNISDVWDGATILSDEPVIFSVISCLATITTTAGEFDVPITGKHIGELSLGWDALDGELPPSMRHTHSKAARRLQEIPRVVACPTSSGLPLDAVRPRAVLVFRRRARVGPEPAKPDQPISRPWTTSHIGWTRILHRP